LTNPKIDRKEEGRKKERERDTHTHTQHKTIAVRKTANSYKRRKEA
jgi:hypothetical protein